MENGNLIFLLLVLVSFGGLYKIFQKTGKPAWKALIPFYNFYEWLKLLEKPWWWVFLMVVPGVNIIMYGVLGYHTALYFGKRKTSDLLAASLMPYLYVVFLGFSKTEKWVGLSDLKSKKGGFVKNWVDPLLFAVVAATVIRTFFLEAFTIPTSSLEKSLMVGDFLFVNKFAYGPKIPQTPLAFPFAHHTLPFTKTTKSYLEWLKLPYMRLPGYSKVKNYDIVVFNYPDGDTVALGAQDRSYYELEREYGYTNMHNPHFVYDNKNDNDPMNDLEVGEITARPPDKREHYVKRCVAIAGDKFEVRAGEIYINDKLMPMPEHAQHFYNVKTTGPMFGLVGIDPETGQYGFKANLKLLDKLDIYVTEAFPYSAPVGDTMFYALNMPVSTMEKVKAMPGVLSVEMRMETKGEYDRRIFPHKSTYKWNNDYFGPLTIPKKGVTVNIDTANICLYDRVIQVYDNNKLEIKGDKIFINGLESKQYTFKQDYYFMMGDNRHNSADSRCWGLVPFDHIVGKPVFVWFSMKDPQYNPVSGKGVLSSLTKNSKEGKFRWERFFSYVDDKGLHSWFWQTIVFIALLIFGPKLWRRYRGKKSRA